MITMSSIILTSGDFFAKGEYLVANSAYPVSLITVPSFKGPGLSVDQTAFNICVAHVRSVNESCIGMLKRRWGSLTEVPLTTRSEEKVERDMTKAITWIVVCGILHNVLIEERDFLDDDETKAQFQATVLAGQVPTLLNYATGRELRDGVMRTATALGRRPHGIVSHKDAKRKSPEMT